MRCCSRIPESACMFVDICDLVSYGHCVHMYFRYCILDSACMFVCIFASVFWLRGRLCPF